MAVLIGGGGQALDLQTGDVVHIGLDVGADVAHAVGNAGEFGVLPPDGQVLLGALLGLQLVDEPVLHILGVDGGDLADLAGGDHVLHNPAHGVAGIGIGHGKEQILLLGQGLQLLRLSHLEAQGLLTHHVDARQQELLGDLIVEEVGGADGDEVDAVLPGGLRLCHLLVVGIHPAGIDAVGLGSILVLRRDVGEAAAHQLRPGIKGDGLAMHLADEGVHAAAHHAVSQFFCHAFRPAFPQPLEMASSNLISDFLKSTLRTKAAASVAPSMRSIPLSSHSTDRGPS